MVSMLAVLKSGEAIEAGIIGPEGFVGGYLGARGWRAFGHAVMQMSGEAMRLNVRHFKKAYDASDELRILINGYQSVVYFQAQQTAACQALHPVEARMCRWLLQAQDAIGGDTLESDAGISLAHAGRAPHQRLGQRQQAAGRRLDHLQARRHPHSRPQRFGKSVVRMLRAPCAPRSPAAEG